MAQQDQTTAPQACRACGQPLPVEQAPNWDSIEQLVKGSRR